MTKGVQSMITIAIICSILGLLFALFTSRRIVKHDEGSSKMKNIARHIRAGAMAFLFREYKVLSLFAIIVFLILGFAISWLTAIAFSIGACLSVFCGFIGMQGKRVQQ